MFNIEYVRHYCQDVSLQLKKSLPLGDKIASKLPCKKCVKTVTVSHGTRPAMLQPNSAVSIPLRWVFKNKIVILSESCIIHD